ncbi:MAG: ATP-dependent zinc metalloprotease FtsH [Patescibacteria group bacterium]
MAESSKTNNNSSKTNKSSAQESPNAPKKGRQKEASASRIFTLRIDLNKLFNKGFVYFLLFLLFLPFLISAFTRSQAEDITLNQLVSDIREEKIEKVEVSGSDLRAFYEDGSQAVTRKEDGQQLLQILEAADIDVASIDLDIQNLGFMEYFMAFLPTLLLIAVMVGFALFFLRQARGAQDGIMGIGRSKAKLFIKGKQNMSFKDVGGMDEAKKELEEIVDFLKSPKKYHKMGARTPKGVLLVGPSGTGKTLLARAVAGEANVQFLSIAGSEFMEMLVGVGASRARDLFTTAKKIAPSIIFIDEIDAIGRVRGHGSMGGHDEREQTLNQILVEMDGFAQNDNVIVMAATNRGDMLDPALVRPGRFDRRVTVNLPDLEERKYILSIHSKNKPFAKALDWLKVAKRTVGFSGADIENMLNEAAIAVARESRALIGMPDIEEASLKVKLGPSKRRLQDVLERKMTAYHETGHAIVAHVSPHSDPVHRISIISRGRALGYTLTPPERDKLQTTKSELIDEIAVLLGGRAAERLIFNELTAGASSDIDRATRIARAMVVDYGMSELGAMNFSPQYETSNYTRAMGEPMKISDVLQQEVDVEIRKIISQGEKRAMELLKKHRKQLDAVSKKLLELESLDGDEFLALMGVPKNKISE